MYKTQYIMPVTTFTQQLVESMIGMPTHPDYLNKELTLFVWGDDRSIALWTPDYLEAQRGLADVQDQEYVSMTRLITRG